MDECELVSVVSLTPSILHRIQKNMSDLIAISDQEAERFIGNAVAFGDTVISPKGMSQNRIFELEKRGKKVEGLNLSEFMKGAGAVQWLILKL